MCNPLPSYFYDFVGLFQLKHCSMVNLPKSFMKEVVKYFFRLLCLSSVFLIQYIFISQLVRFASCCIDLLDLCLFTLVQSIDH